MIRFFSRIYRAARLDPQLYEEVEEDRGATLQAAAVVVLFSLAAGLAAPDGMGTVALSIGIHVGGWCVWAFLTSVIGTRILAEPQTVASWGELLRTLGFATSPGLIRVLGIIPALAPVVFWVSWVWILVAMIIAVRQALDYRSTLRAVAVCVVGFLIVLVVITLTITPAG